MPWIFSQARYTLSHGLLSKNFPFHAAYDQTAVWISLTPGSLFGSADLCSQVLSTGGFWAGIANWDWERVIAGPDELVQ